jgi:RimJ/RimL family protein N-acetyltransferase
VSSADWIVRSIEVSDAVSYIEFLSTLDHETEFLLWEPGERTITIESIENQIKIANPNMRFHSVAVVSGKVIGFIVGLRGFQKRVQHKADFTMGVLSQFSGLGIGNSLFESFERWAKANQIQRLELSVMSHNNRAIVFYEKQGFQLEGIKKNSFCVRGRLVDENMMGKLLNDG